VGKKHQHEVDNVEGLIKELAKLDPEDASWLTKLKAVHASLESHIREEEQDIFPRISKAWDETKLEQAGTEMQEMKAKKVATMR
jgi:iron-sulfur cluster repair protein YtfE (RIC family)